MRRRRRHLAIAAAALSTYPVSFLVDTFDRLLRSVWFDLAGSLSRQPDFSGLA